MRYTWTFHSAGQLLFGRNAVRQLGQIAQRINARRVLVITDAKLVKADLAEQVTEPLQKNGVITEVFAEGQPEPSVSVANECIAFSRKFVPDAILGLGGGSNMDLAKITATVLSHGGDPLKYSGENTIPGPIWPLICVPTTSGTGSEVSAAAVLTDTENQMKFGVLSNYLRPRVALVDPMLTVGCPAKVTADSGIDALTHAVEAYTAVDNAEFPLPDGEPTAYQGRNPMGDCLAEKAIRLVGQYLKRAVQDGDDLEAREGMATAATLAGLAFSNVGVALVHAMEYPVGGAVHVSHGAGNGLLLPHVMRFNQAVRGKELARIAYLLGADISELDRGSAAERAVTAVEQLRDAIGIPKRLHDLGVKEDQLRTFAEKAASIKRLLRVSPRPVTVEDIEGIYRAAF